MEKRNKTSAGLLGIFLGAYGAHHFYLGNTDKGLLYLLLSLLTAVCFPIFAVIGFVEGIQYLCMTDEEFRSYCDDIASDEKDLETKWDETSVAATNKYKLLLKYKSLLDSEAITLEEFESIKRQIMR